jgi:class 3 adenylate cyclase
VLHLPRQVSRVAAVHHGRVVKRTGDGSIIEFRSVVDAVHRAVPRVRPHPVRP